MTSIFKINTDYFFGVLKKIVVNLVRDNIFQHRNAFGRTTTVI